jgi:AcrR family transcriptional regulator
MVTLSHDERRHRIAEVVMSVIAREGLDAATVRRIAAEVGFSTTVITHYFADKHDLLLSAYHTLSEIAGERFERIFANDPSDLVGYLMSLAAAEEADLLYWRTFIAIWDRSLRDPDFAAELHSWLDTALTRIQAFIPALDPGCPDPERVARRLMALVHGVSAQRLFYPQSWSAAAVRETLASEVELLLTRR